MNRDTAEILSFYGTAAGGIATALAFVIAALWTWKHFIARSDLKPKIELGVDLEFFGVHPKEPDKIVVEVRCTVKNCGLVRLKLPTLSYSIRTLRVDDLVIATTRPDPLPTCETPPAERKDLLGQIAIGHAETTPKIFFPEYWVHSYVDPGVTTTYSSITAISREAWLVRVSAKFPYSDKKGDDHSTQRAFRVPPDGLTAAQNR